MRKQNIRHPLPVGFLGRKRAVDFYSTTLETWKKIIPAHCYEIKQQDKEIVIDGKVKIDFGGLDDQETVNKFNSAEYAFYAIDQAEETERGDVSVLAGSLRLKREGIQPKYKRLYTANPAECWLKEDFINNPRPEYRYIPALPTDNPHLPDNYLKTLDDAFGYDPVLLAAYKDGNWDAMQSMATLITMAKLEVLKGINHAWYINQDIVVTDPSLGGDECVTYQQEY